VAIQYTSAILQRIWNEVWKERQDNEATFYRLQAGIMRARGSIWLLCWPGTLRLEQNLAWADTHHARTWKWPTRTAADIADASEEIMKGMRLNRGVEDTMRSNTPFVSQRGGARSQNLKSHLHREQLVRFALLDGFAPVLEHGLAVHKGNGD
jgi:hypothetical protein